MRVSRALASLLVFLAFSTAFSWPVARFDDVLPVRQFDLYGVLWVLEYSREMVPGLYVPDAGGTAGQDLGRLDSFVLLGIGWIFDGWVRPLRIAQAIIVIGPALSAWAAERCAARGFGVAWPWSLVAGFAFGFNGLVAAAILEGHVPHVFDPWLPLLALALVRASSPGARWTDGALAGVAWVLALLTTGYLGIDGGILAAAFAVRALLLRPRFAPLVGVAVAAVATAAVPTAIWAHQLTRAGEGLGGLVRSSPLSGASLVALTAWTPEIDLFEHSQAAPVGFALAGLALAAPRVLGAARGWRTLLAVASLCVVLALGTMIRFGPTDPSAWRVGFLPYLHAPFFGLVRFPIRFVWVWYLGAGLVAAQVAGVLAVRAGRRPAALLVGLIGAECLLASALPARLNRTEAAVPSAYFATPPDGRLFELFAESPDVLDDSWMWERQVACWYQTLHRRPVAHQCIGTGEDPHLLATRALYDRLSEMDTAAEAKAEELRRVVVDDLREAEIAAVVVHESTFDQTGLELLGRTLPSVLGAAAGRSRNGGEVIAVYAVPQP